MVDRRLATAAGAALTATGGLAFARVFDSGGFVLPVLGAAAIPFAIGVLLRRARAGPLLAMVVSAAAGAVYALIAVHGWNPLDGFPDLGTVERDLRAGWEVVRTEAPPVEAASGPVLILVAATWVVGLVVDQLVDRGATVGALAPPLALFVVATALGADRGPAAPATVSFAVAACALLLFQQQARAGRRRGTFVGRRVRAGTGVLATGTALGLIAVFVGVAVAPALPGADDGPLLDYRGLTNDRGGVYEPGVLPVVDVGAQLERGERTEVFRVRAERPAYWRLVALDEFEGNWTLDAPEGSIDEGLDEQARDAFVQEFAIGSLRERWMPAAYRARRVIGGNPSEIRASTTVVTGEDSVSGLRYTVESELPAALAEVTAEDAAATDRRFPDDLDRYTALPDDFSGAISVTAADVTADTETPFDRALALRDFFRGPTFNYDPNARYNTPNPEDGEAVIEEFLRQRNGFCVQFASAFALMARSVGLPTRIAVGFTPGRRANGEYVVTNYEAHAWPEVYLVGIGWTNMFDPTPPSDFPGGSDLPGDVTSGLAGPVAPPTTTTTVAPTTTTSPAGETPQTLPSVEVSDPTSTDDGASRRWLTLALVPTALVLLAGAYVGAVVGVKRRRRARRRRAGAPDAVVGAWQEVIDRLAEADVATLPTVTPLELSAALSRDNAPAGRALARLAHVYGAVYYGAVPVDRAEAEAAWRHVGEVERALDRGVSTTTRWRRRLTTRR